MNFSITNRILGLSVYNTHACRHRPTLFLFCSQELVSWKERSTGHWQLPIKIHVK